MVKKVGKSTPARKAAKGPKAKKVAVRKAAIPRPVRKRSATGSATRNAGPASASNVIALQGRLVDVDQVATDYALTKSALAQSLGFADETLHRSERAKAPKTQQRLREMLEILLRVEPWTGGKLQAMTWYRAQGIPALGDQTAEALVKQDNAGLVRNYLDAVAAGAYA